MGIGIIAGQMTVVKPQHTFHAEQFLKFQGHLLLVQRGVPVGIEQTGGSGKQRAATVAFNTAAFKFKVECRNISAPQQAGVVDMAVDGIIILGPELTAPAIETEIDQFGTIGTRHSNKGMVACPGVVSRAGMIHDIVRSTTRQLLFKKRTHGGRVGRDDKQLLARGYLKGQMQVAVNNIVKHIFPVGTGMRPRKLNATLLEPFRRHRAAMADVSRRRGIVKERVHIYFRFARIAGRRTQG